MFPLFMLQFFMHLGRGHEVTRAVARAELAVWNERASHLCISEGRHAEALEGVQRQCEAAEGKEAEVQAHLQSEVSNAQNSPTIR